MSSAHSFRDWRSSSTSLGPLRRATPSAGDSEGQLEEEKNPSPQSFLMEIRLNLPMSPIGRQKCSSAVRRGFTPVLSQAHQAIQPHRCALGGLGQNPERLRTHAAPGRNLAADADHRRHGEADLLLGVRRRQAGSTTKPAARGPSPLFEPQYEEFSASTMWSLSNAFTSAHAPVTAITDAWTNRT